MREIVKQIYNNKWGKYLLIPSLLFLLWLGLTSLYIITFDTSLSVISYTHNEESFNNINYNKLLKKNKISGEFKAVEDNLGIVSIKFQTFIRPPYLNEDTLVFRIREKGANKWYSQGNYRDGMVYELPFFPFGFPKIVNSKGKIYYFEIESLYGNANNSIALSNRGQNLFSKYQVPKSLLLHDRQEFAIFIIQKFMSAMITSDVRFSSFIYLLPLIFYFLWLSPFGKNVAGPFIRKLYKPFSPVSRFIRTIITLNMHLIIVGVVLIDVFIIQLTNDLIYLVIIVLWIAVLNAYKMKSTITFALVLTLLIIPPVFVFFKDTPTAEKGAIWAFMFLVAGVTQILFEFEKKIY